MGLWHLDRAFEVASGCALRLGGDCGGLNVSHSGVSNGWGLNERSRPAVDEEVLDVLRACCSIPSSTYAPIIPLQGAANSHANALYAAALTNAAVLADGWANVHPRLKAAARSAIAAIALLTTQDAEKAKNITLRMNGVARNAISALIPTEKFNVHIDYIMGGALSAPQLSVLSVLILYAGISGLGVAAPVSLKGLNLAQAVKASTDISAAIRNAGLGLGLSAQILDGAINAGPPTPDQVDTMKALFHLKEQEAIQLLIADGAVIADSSVTSLVGPGDDGVFNAFNFPPNGSNRMFTTGLRGATNLSVEIHSPTIAQLLLARAGATGDEATYRHAVSLVPGASMKALEDSMPKLSLDDARRQRFIDTISEAAKWLQAQKLRLRQVDDNDGDEEMTPTPPTVPVLFPGDPLLIEAQLMGSGACLYDVNFFNDLKGIASCGMKAPGETATKLCQDAREASWEHPSTRIAARFLITIGSDSATFHSKMFRDLKNCSILRTNFNGVRIETRRARLVLPQSVIAHFPSAYLLNSYVVFSIARQGPAFLWSRALVVVHLVHPTNDILLVLYRAPIASDGVPSQRYWAARRSPLATAAAVISLSQGLVALAASASAFALEGVDGIELSPVVIRGRAILASRSRDARMAPVGSDEGSDEEEGGGGGGGEKACRTLELRNNLIDAGVGGEFIGGGGMRTVITTTVITTTVMERGVRVRLVTMTLMRT